jgi:small subunit ribosomal protein S4
MKIGPKYKIARRLGVPVFEKTQNPKFALREERREATRKPRAKSDYAIGMLEKQKARYTYCVTERQFSNYVREAIAGGSNKVEHLINVLESRLDNAVLRAGLAPTRLAARQMVSHGHILVNGNGVKVPSYRLHIGDVITIREGSQKKPLFATVTEKLTAAKIPAWLKVDIEKKQLTVDGRPIVPVTELLFNPSTVIEFYTR